MYICIYICYMLNPPRGRPYMCIYIYVVRESDLDDINLNVEYRGDYRQILGCCSVKAFIFTEQGEKLLH